MTPRRAGWAALTGLGLALLAAPAAAQDEGDPRARAAEHFDRGITFFNERRYDAALAELGRAHELAPAPATLYNLARVHAALGHAVEAADTYQAYLDQAGRIDAARRREVEAALAVQRERIGTLRVTADVDGAIVAIDGVDATTTPIDAPLRLSAGTHNVEVRAPGHETVRRAVAIAGLTEATLDVSLREEVVTRGTVRLETSVPEVAIAIDGEPIGVTPLGSTVSLREGDHALRATRPGYQPEERRIHVEGGAEAEVTLTMRRDPSPPPEHLGQVRLRLPDAPSLVRVNGETVTGDTLELPVGAHVLTLEVTDRRPYEDTVRVPAGTTVVIVPPLAWTLDAREERLGAARTQLTAGITMTAVGIVPLAVGIGLLVWNEGEIARTDGRLGELQQMLDACELEPTPTCVMQEPDWLAEGRSLEEGTQPGQDAIRGTSIALVAVGGLLTVVGVGLWIAAPAEDDVDAAAQGRARLEVGPGGVQVRGAF